MKIALIGSRGFVDYPLFCSKLDSLIRRGVLTITEVISGGNGAGTLAARFARERGLPLHVFAPNYARYGRSAPLVRNEAIVEACEGLVAFHDMASKGTAHALRLAQSRAKRVIIVVPVPGSPDGEAAGH